MRTHHIQPNQYHSPHKDKQSLSDAMLVAAVITIVMMLFIAYMWYTVAHYSAEPVSSATVQTETSAGPGISNAPLNGPPGSSINNADNPAAATGSNMTPGSNEGGTNASPTNSSPPMAPSTGMSPGKRMGDSNY